MIKNIPFNKPYMTGKELEYISHAHAQGHLSGDGMFTRRCSQWLEQRVGSAKALLTHSSTAALEMAAILANIGPGDEVIMPSYTFVSTANAFVLRGATPVFVDVRPDTLNIDEARIEAAITERTRAIVPVHYAGVSCDMERIMDIAGKYNLIVIEDAAQAIMSMYKGSAVGKLGHLSCFSFHETKNIISGEGGALLINDPELVQRAEIIREKGTNRSQFFRGQVDKYTWCDVGSSYLPSELIAGFLWAQMEAAEEITNARIDLWEKYHSAFEKLELSGRLRRPLIPKDCIHNAHLYYILMPDLGHRSRMIENLKQKSINAVFHYVPLHTSPAGMHYGRTNGDLSITSNISDRLLRLPLWVGLEQQIDEVIEGVHAYW